MSLFSTAGEVEREAHKKSVLHSLEGRIKIIAALMIIIYAVIAQDILKLLALECYLLGLALIARLRMSLLAKRLFLILPFGGAIAFFQPFLRSGTVLYALPLGINVTYEGIMLGALLFSKLMVCITSVALLSSVSPMHELIASARRLGIPREVTLIFGLLARYLFVFYDVFQRMRLAQETRCFRISNRRVSYLWTLEQISYSISQLFMRAYEQGERTYISMLSRGYNPETKMYVEKKRIEVRDCLYLFGTIGIVIAVELFL